MKSQSKNILLRSVLCTVAFSGLVACNNGGDSVNPPATDGTQTDPAADEPMTSINAELMLQNYVTSNVEKIRVASTDETGKILSTAVLTRSEALDFSVPTVAEKVEMGLLTESAKQIGVIIFKPEGEEMTLTLPGEGLSFVDLLNLDMGV